MDGLIQYKIPNVKQDKINEKKRAPLGVPTLIKWKEERSNSKEEIKKK